MHDARTHLSTQPKAWREYALAYIGTNPFLALSGAGVLLGGVLLLMYFLHIGFFPDADASGVLGLLYAVAIIGGGFLAAAAIILILPGLGLAWMKSIYQPPGELTYSFLVGLWSYSAVISIILIFFLENRYGLWPQVINSVLFGLFAWFISGSSKYWWPTITLGFAGSIAGFVVFVVILSLTLGFGQSLLLQRDDAGTWLSLIAVVVAAIIFAGGLAASPLEDAPRLALWGAPLLLLLLLSVTQGFGVTSAKVVHRLSLGEQDVARVVLSKTGCHQVNLALGETICQPPTNEGEEAVICPVRLRSRIGNQVVLEFSPLEWSTDKVGWLRDPNDATKLARRVVIEKAQMLAWSPLSWSAVAPAKPAASAHTLARLPALPTPTASAASAAASLTFAVCMPPATPPLQTPR